jgi:hypothetical protein
MTPGDMSIPKSAAKNTWHTGVGEKCQLNVSIFSLYFVATINSVY